jgi:hypothetical protein
MDRLEQFQDVSAGIHMLAADNWSTPQVLIANPAALAGVSRRLRVRRVTIAVTTSAAQTVQLRSVTTDVPVCGLAASVAIGPYTFDFGDVGRVLPTGEGLEIVTGGAGVAATFQVEAYAEPVQ